MAKRKKPTGWIPEGKALQQLAAEGMTFRVRIDGIGEHDVVDLEIPLEDTGTFLCDPFAYQIDRLTAALKRCERERVAAEKAWAVRKAAAKEAKKAEEAEEAVRKAAWAAREAADGTRAVPTVRALSFHTSMPAERCETVTVAARGE